LNSMSDELQDVKKENEDLKKKISELENKMEGNDEKVLQFVQLEKRIEEMKLSQCEKEQYDRNKNIEINGLEENPKENLHDVMKKMADAYGIQDYRTDVVEKMHRIPSKNKEKVSSIIVQFKRREDRDKWISAKKRTVTNDQILQNSNGKRIFVNENMTPHFRQLFWKAKNFAKENKYKYVWFKNGKVLMRKEESDKAVMVIRSERDLK